MCLRFKAYCCLSLSALVILLLVGPVFDDRHTAAATNSCEQIKAQPHRWVGLTVDALVLAARAAYEDETADEAYQKLVRAISVRVKQCQLTQDENFTRRYQQFLNYIELSRTTQLPDHELGFLLPDKQYFDETRQYVQIPEFLLDRQFLRAVSREETLSRAKSFLRELNSQRSPSDQLLFFSYNSQHLGTPDNDGSFKRLLIVVPGDALKGIPEKWVQFGITDRGKRLHIRNLSIVSALANADGTSNVYFKDYFRTYKRDGSITVNGRWELGYGDDKCVTCHKSGILPVFPEPDSVSNEELQTLRAVNERFLTYGAASFEKYLDAGSFGPGVSSATEASRSVRFGPAFSSSVVGRSMNCVACHHPQRLGYLNWPMDSVLIGSFVKGGQMPQGHDLKVAERNELYKKLVQEYFAIDNGNPGILKSWLLR